MLTIVELLIGMTIRGDSRTKQIVKVADDKKKAADRKAGDATEKAYLFLRYFYPDTGWVLFFLGHQVCWSHEYKVEQVSMAAAVEPFALLLLSGRLLLLNRLFLLRRLFGKLETEISELEQSELKAVFEDFEPAVLAQVALGQVGFSSLTL